jgi:hypothetical protein
MRVGGSPPVWQKGAAGERKLAGCSSGRRKPEPATTDGASRRLFKPAELKDDVRCESEVIAGLAGGWTPTQVGRSAASRQEVRSARREPSACHRSSQAGKHRSEPGKSAFGRAGKRASRRKLKAARRRSQRKGRQRKLQVHHWGSRGTRQLVVLHDHQD